MVINSSNATDQLAPSSSSISTYQYDFLLSCFLSKVGVFDITAFTIISILFLPLFVTILHLGFQQKQRSATTMRHSDVITYNVVVLELLNISGSVICCCGVYANLPMMIKLGLLIFPLKLTGQMLFHILTCLERYLAVVHPVTYVALRTTKGIQVRNFAIGCVWGFSLVSISTLSVVDELLLILISSCTVGFCLLLISFFSVSVLCVLIRPRPGEGPGDRPGVDQSKLRAFYTIMSIMGLLFLRSGANLMTIIKVDGLQMGQDEKCGIWLSVFWFCLPSSLVLPLLFLQRAGKLSLCQKKARHQIRRCRWFRGNTTAPETKVRKTKV